MQLTRMLSPKASKCNLMHPPIKWEEDKHSGKRFSNSNNSISNNFSSRISITGLEMLFHLTRCTLEPRTTSSHPMGTHR